MQPWGPALGIAASVPLLSGCLTSVAVLAVAVEGEDALNRHRRDVAYVHPARDTLRTDGRYAFSGDGGAATVVVAGPRVSVHLENCADISGVLSQTRFPTTIDRYAVAPFYPDRIRSLDVEAVTDVHSSCSALSHARTVQIEVADRRGDRGGFGTALLINAFDDLGRERFDRIFGER